MTHPGVHAPLPQFEVRLAPPDLDRWREGNTGVPGFTTLKSAVPGPHVGILALTHGNEYAGAIVLDRLLRAGIMPLRGRLTIGFVNLAAFDRFDPRQPTVSRFVDEDFNRLWDPAVLDGRRRSAELDRARQIRPVIDSLDVLLDVHSMLWPSDPVMLSGTSAAGLRLATAIGAPAMVVADSGHLSGRRIIDYPRFNDPAPGEAGNRPPGEAGNRPPGEAGNLAQGRAGNLVEAGQHWETATVDMAAASVAGLLRHTRLVVPDAYPAERAAAIAPLRFAVVTEAVTAATVNFAFVQNFRGGEVIARRNTLLALDGPTEIRTPYDDCLLVMPSLRPGRGHTAVRLARFTDGT